VSPSSFEEVSVVDLKVPGVAGGVAVTGHGNTRRGVRLRILCAAAVLAATLTTVPAQDGPTPPTSSAASPWLPADVKPQCLFQPNTVIPRLAMGVRRLGDDPDLRARRFLDLWERPERPDLDAKPLKRVQLFRPLFVYDVREHDGVSWHLLGDAYAGSPVGWADGRQVHQLDSRYGYHFSNPKRAAPGVQLYESRERAYEAILAQSMLPPDNPRDGAVVEERLEEQYWNPIAPGATPPFVEMRDDDDLAALYAEGLTDTTLTFTLDSENVLLHLGAVAGGPIDRDAVARKRDDADKQAGIAIAFVVDETVSMGRYFGDVADFIENNLDVGPAAVNLRVAVSWYSDREKPADIPYVANSLEPLNAPGITPQEAASSKARIVRSVREHKERIVRGEGAQPEELIYPGLNAAIETAGFRDDERAMVFVIGDAADRMRGAALRAAQVQLQGLIRKHKLQVAFVQVGDLGPGFAQQAKDFRDALPQGEREAVLVQGVEDGRLQKRIADLRAQMDRQRQTLLDEIAEMESRNHYAQPGPALDKQFDATGVDRQAFDREHLQLFVPAWGWLYHPQTPDALPQLRELVFLAKPEADALIPVLVTAVDGLRTTGRIDMDAVRNKFTQVLGRQSGHTDVASAVDAAWQALPEGDRTLGRFLRDSVGLRVRNAILYHPAAADIRAAATQRDIELLTHSRERLGMARAADVIWFDASKVLP
jgi:hypothetical protein